MLPWIVWDVFTFIIICDITFVTCSITLFIVCMDLISEEMTRLKHICSFYLRDNLFHWWRKQQLSKCCDYIVWYGVHQMMEKVLLFTSDVSHRWTSLQYIKCNILLPVLYCGLNGESSRYNTPSKFLPVSMMAKGAGSNVQIHCSNFYGVLEYFIHKRLFVIT
jgi:hypothetical protein